MKDHPLFPPETDDDEAPEVEGIHVSRFGEGPPKWCSYLFAADELTELQQIQELFGGGTYELIARAAGRITARRRYCLDGRSRPLVYGVASGAEPPTVPTQPQPQPQAAPPGDMGFMGLLVQMMNNQAQSNQAMMMAVMQNVSAMATAMVSRDSDSAKATLQAMAQVQNQAMAQQSAFFNAMMTTKGGGGSDVVKSFREGLELGRSTSIPDGDEDGGLGETIAQAVEGLKLVNQMTGDGPAGEVVEVTEVA